MKDLSSYLTISAWYWCMPHCILLSHMRDHPFLGTAFERPLGVVSQKRDYCTVIILLPLSDTYNRAQVVYSYYNRWSVTPWETGDLRRYSYMHISCSHIQYNTLYRNTILITHLSGMYCSNSVYLLYIQCFPQKRVPHPVAILKECITIYMYHAPCCLK